MTEAMAYKGFSAYVDFDDEDGVFVGRIAGIRDGVGFHAESAAALRLAFRDAVGDYIDTCVRIGKEPERPYVERCSQATYLSSGP